MAPQTETTSKIVTGTKTAEVGQAAPAPATVIVTDSQSDGGVEKRRRSYISQVIIPVDIGTTKSKETNNQLQQSSQFFEESDYSSCEEDDNDLDEDDEVDSQTSIVKEGSQGNSSTNISTVGSLTPSGNQSGNLTGNKPPWWRKYRGMMLAIVSSFIFAMSSLLVKKLDSFDPFNSALYKFQGALLPAIPLLLQKYHYSRKGPKVVENVWPLTEKKKLKTFGLVLLRSFLTCNALLLHFFSLKYLPMADALTISSASPIFVTILAKIFLGEKFGYSTIIASVCSLLGVVAIAKPPFLYNSNHFDSDVLIGTGLAFGCTILSATSFITLRYIRKVHYSVTTLMYGTWGTIENLIIVLLLPGLTVPANAVEWGLIIGLAVLTFFGQFSIIFATKLEQAGPVALVRTFDVLFAFLFDIAFLSRLPDMWSLIGAAVIVLSVIFVGLRKWVKSFPRGHPLRQKLKFIIL